MGQKIEIVEDENSLESKDSKIDFNDPTIKKRLNSFKDKLSTENLVSNSDIMALEEFIGTPIITDKIKKSKFTQYPSNIGVDESIKLVVECLSENESQETVDIQMVILLYNAISNFVKSNIRLITKLYGNESEIVLRLLSEIHRYCYVVDEDYGVKYKLVDMCKNSSIAYILKYESRYINAACEKEVNSTLNLIDESFLELLDNNLNIEMFLINKGVYKYLNGDLSETNLFTIYRLIDNIVYNDTILQNLKNVKVLADDWMHFALKASDNEDMNKAYRKLIEFKKIINDNPLFVIIPLIFN